MLDTKFETHRTRTEHGTRNNSGIILNETVINEDCLYLSYSLVPNTVWFMTELYIRTDLSSLTTTVFSHEGGSFFQLRLD